MRIQQMIIGMLLLLSFGVSQAGETRHFMGIYSDSYSNGDIDSTSYQYGYDFSNLISVEVNFSAPDVTGTTAGLYSIDSVSNVMLRFNNRYESINTYFMIGATNVALTTVTPVADEAITGLAYGIGIELYGSKNTAISFTWTSSEFDEADSVTKMDTTRIGLIHHFDFGKPSSRY